jgi:acetoin utilization deacetylase AcuC-like enzyme
MDLKLAFEEVIKPVIFEYRPEFLAISAGFDAYERDPIGVMGVTIEGFTFIGEEIREIADTMKIPIANYLEGGYNIDLLPDLLSAYISPLIREDVGERIHPTTNPKPETTSTIERSKNLLREYWKLD